VATVMADLGLLAREKHIEMSLEGPEDALVHSDAALLKLMLHNLVENAIKYTPAHGQVWVQIMPHVKGYQLSITDTGCGIPVEERALVFGRFYRVATPEQEGSGLGLALVAEIIEKLGGSIALQSPPSAVGLRVEVLLPMAELEH